MEMPIWGYIVLVALCVSGGYQIRQPSREAIAHASLTGLGFITIAITLGLHAKKLPFYFYLLLICYYAVLYAVGASSAGMLEAFLVRLRKEMKQTGLTWREYIKHQAWIDSLLVVSGTALLVLWVIHAPATQPWWLLLALLLFGWAQIHLEALRQRERERRRQERESKRRDALARAEAPTMPLDSIKEPPTQIIDPKNR